MYSFGALIYAKTTRLLCKALARLSVIFGSDLRTQIINYANHIKSSGRIKGQLLYKVKIKYNL